MYKRFEKLKAWQLAREFRRTIYQITKSFPKNEEYILISQTRRAAISITANIAEGHGRYYYQENIQFCRVSRGSINEVLDHLYAALDEQYISQQVFDGLYKQGREAEQVLNGYISYLERQKPKKSK